MLKKYVIVIEIALILLFGLFNFFLTNKKETEISPLIPTFVSSPTFGQLPNYNAFGDRKLSSFPTFAFLFFKDSYKIAVIGDSMVETMGENLDYLDKAFKEKYPRIKFQLYNYGVGSENVISAYQRLDSLLIKEDPFDIIIVGTWGYNPVVPFDQNIYSVNFEKIIKRLSKTNAKIYVLAEIAPLKVGFGQGSGGVNWPEEIYYPHVENILNQIHSAIYIAQKNNVPLIDAYSPSKKPSSLYGQENYVNSHDGIHPSILGHQFMAEKIVSVIEIK